MNAEAGTDAGARRLLIGNLDCEASWAGGGKTSRRALETASAFATLMRVFAEPGDRLWTPVAVDPARLPEVEGLAMPELVSGPLSSLPPSSLVLAWGETEEVSALRLREGDTEAPVCEARRRGTTRERIWRLPTAAPEVAARVNHRRYCFDLAQEWGIALPGSAWIENAAALQQHLAAASSHLEEWVLKAPHSTAGRQRVVSLQGSDRAENLQRAGRLLERSRGGVIEPWLRRLEDFGACGLVGEHRVRLFPMHRQAISPWGGFQGIRIVDGSRDSPEIRRKVEDMARRVGDRLRKDGYRGPFGIDAFTYQGTEGRPALHPLCEINSRSSFGLIAQLLHQRLGEIGPPASTELRLLPGGGPLPENGAQWLLKSSETQPAAGWLRTGGAGPS